MNRSLPNKLGKERYFTKDRDFTAAEHNMKNSFRLHWHEFYEIEYIVSGNAVQTINGIDYEVGPGFAVLVTPADMHSYKNVTKENSLTIHNVKFSPFILPLDLQTRLNGIGAPLCGFCPEIGPLTDTILTEYNGTSLAREQFIISCITQTFIYLLRHGEEVRDFENTPDREMILYIREHFLEPISIETVAQIVHLSPNYFSEYFKTHMGTGFASYVKKMRLEFAANLLSTSDQTVKQVAAQSGYHSLTHFFNNFKSEYGMTPEEFRNTKRQ